jgi:hypothetical protein
VEVALRRLGQLLVVMGAVVGALSGVALALLVEHAESSRSVAAPGRERAAVLAAHLPSSQPQPLGAARSQDPTAGNASSGTRRAESADRVDQRPGKAQKNHERHQDKAGGKSNPARARDYLARASDEPYPELGTR